jgi:hypothetical protein
MKKSLCISANSKIFIPAPPKTSTGGPEAIHRLLNFLKVKCGMDVYVYYYPSNVDDPVHAEYRNLNVPYAEEVIDKKENILIVPDYYNHLILHTEYIYVQKCIWWLSVDFFYQGVCANVDVGYNFKLLNRFVRLQNLFNTWFPSLIEHTDLAKVCLDKTKNLDINLIANISDVDFHFCQSVYAYNWLNQFNIGNKLMLTDFFDEKLINQPYIDFSDKEDIVAYNPSKGFSFTKHIIYLGQGIKFVPIKDMTKNEVLALLRKSKVFIDFGNHPGRDRLPREAMLAGCCVITSKRGSASYFEDVPIPDKYKFNDEYSEISKIVELINAIMSDFNLHSLDFNEYLNFCKNINIQAEEDISLILDSLK